MNKLSNLSYVSLIKKIIYPLQLLSALSYIQHDPLVLKVSRHRNLYTLFFYNCFIVLFTSIDAFFSWSYNSSIIIIQQLEFLQSSHLLLIVYLCFLSISILAGLSFINIWSNRYIVDTAMHTTTFILSSFLIYYLYSNLTGLNTSIQLSWIVLLITIGIWTTIKILQKKIRRSVSQQPYHLSIKPTDYVWQDL